MINRKETFKHTHIKCLSKTPRAGYERNIITNVSDAKSRIQDVDFASETANMTSQNVIQQAAAAVLSQANNASQIALSLLQG